VRRLRFTVPREQQQRAGKEFLSRIEKLVDEVFFDADVPRQHVRQETIRERWRRVELTHHLRFFNHQNRGRGHGRCGRHPVDLSGETALAEEMAGVEHSGHGFFSRMRQDRQPHSALLDKHHARRWIALGKDLCRRLVLDALQSHPRPIDNIDGFYRRCALRFAHRTSPPCSTWLPAVRTPNATLLGTDCHQGPSIANRRGLYARRDVTTERPRRWELAVAAGRR
jgi:hypothetical protein